MAEFEDMESMGDDEFEEAQATFDDQVENAPVIEDTVVQDTPEPEVADEPVVEDEPEEVLDEDVGEETLEDSEAPEVDAPQHDDVEPDETVVEEAVEESQQDTDDSFDYKATYEELMKPIKVSGKDVQVKSVQDLRDLANMGIDYSRKMRDIKPLRAIGETLAQAGIITNGKVDEAALTRLLDISSGNKDAIASLLKEQGIDPLDMELDDVNYTPESAIVSDQAIAIQDVEKELVSRGSVDTVITTLGGLDERSKQFFNETPANLLKLEEDIASGVYDDIMGTVNYERSLGRLGELSDMEAYVQFAKASASQQAPQQTGPAPQAKPSNTAKRKAAGISKRQPVNSKKQSYDYINMSDEEFETLTPDTGMY